jgi:phosphoribosylformylglycinamidine synthase
VTIAVVRFPGSNCDRDCAWAVEATLDQPATFVWHDDNELPEGLRGVILPGGFSYGDYLRVGSMASHAHIIPAVKRFAEAGGPVLGICNGFQVLCEIGLLEGALMHNAGGRFVCETVELDVVSSGPWSGGLANDDQLRLPVAHGDGNYVADEATLDKLEAEGRVLFRYHARDADGRATLNGSARGIAGITGGPRGNVCGLMPHPERRAEARLGGTDGIAVLKGLLQ